MILHNKLINMLSEEYSERMKPIYSEKLNKKFIFNDEYDYKKTFIVNILDYIQPNEQVALCLIIHHLNSKGLITNRKFYLPKFKVIIEPNTQCLIDFSSLSDY